VKFPHRNLLLLVPYSVTSRIQRNIIVGDSFPNTNFDISLRYQGKLNCKRTLCTVYIVVGSFLLCINEHITSSFIWQC